MGDSNSSKPGSRPGHGPPPGAPAAARDKPTSPGDPGAGKAGRITHDARGNAVWDWVKDTTRVAIDSTSRLLKRLEVPELTMEDTQEQQVRVESDRDIGGGYDPYSGSTPGRSSGGPRGGGSNSGPSRDLSRSGDSKSGTARKSANTIGGGYDPYGKGVTTRKPPR